MPRRFRFRLSLRLALLVVSLAGVVVWWIYSPLARARVYRTLGWIEQAWDVTCDAPKSVAQIELLALLMQEPVECDGVQVEFWKVELRMTLRKTAGVYEMHPWWIRYGPRGLPIALQELRLRAAFEEPPSPERDERVSALLREGLGRLDELFADTSANSSLPPLQVCAWDLYGWIEIPDPPEWASNTADGLQVMHFKQEWAALASRNDVAGAVARIEQALAEPATSAPNFWDALLKDEWSGEYWMSEGADMSDPESLDLLRSAWELVLEREPSPRRDRLLGAIAAAGVDADFESNRESKWLDAWLAEHTDDPRLPSWVTYGPHGYTVQQFLDQFETWPLGHCAAEVEDPDADLWNLACEGILIALAAKSDPSTPEVAEIAQEVLSRYRTRGDSTLSWFYLIAAEAADRIRRIQLYRVNRFEPPRPSHQNWYGFAHAMRLGHVPSFNTRAPVACIHCGGSFVAAVGVTENAAGEIEWQSESGELRRSPPMVWWLHDWREYYDFVPTFQRTPWIPEIFGGETIARLIKELSNWPWFVCLTQSESLNGKNLERIGDRTSFDDSDILHWWDSHREYTAVISMATRVHVERNLGREDLSQEHRSAVARMAAEVAVMSGGRNPWRELTDDSSAVREAYWNHLLAWRLGHNDANGPTLMSFCDSCKSIETPAPGVELNPDGSLTWTHPLRGLVTIAHPTWAHPEHR